MDDDQRIVFNKKVSRKKLLHTLSQFEPSLFENIVKDKKRKTPVKIFFFGGEAGAAETAHRSLNENGVGAKSCGFYDPGFVSVDEMSSPEIIAAINQCEPDFILVALGAKKGQSWILRNRDSLNAPVISHLGAVINFVSNRIKRSPDVFQKLGLEWVWRIYQEPGLWKRYYFDGVSLLKYVFFGLIPILISKQRKHFSKKNENVSNFVVKDDGIIHISGVITDGNLLEFKNGLVKLLCSTNQRDLTLDCSKLEYINNPAIASLQVFVAAIESKNKTVKLKGLSRSLKSTLKRSLVYSRFAYLM
jgi:N-acetylglucosaminyldiphosphoundecaprenol N-acetyl-beta-D-mannosaminyltransferase